MTHKFIPPHLRKFIVEQNYDNYTAIDHAVWRFIMRISKAFFEKHAHSSYVEGLRKTGITINRIPRVEEMDQKLSEFGWGAVCVRGFIPPAAFMELQSRGILAIAADMRTLDHLTYTPAPDIVHEAAGHAPIIADPNYAHYLHHYGEVSSKAISSREDYNLYLAIRELSDVKEDPTSTPEEIKKAESDLNAAIEDITYISEAAYLARMNWWTVEYGLIGDIKNPKIYGAGLLSSVSESQNCLSDDVKKIPFSLDCINQSYDITEPQPQLFITPDFAKLSEVLEEMADKMAFRIGGSVALEKAIQAKTVCTAEYESKVQVSGKIVNIIKDDFENPIYMQFEGPTQISRFGNELDGHGGDYHCHGFGSPIGKIQNLHKPVCDFNDDDMENTNLTVGKISTLSFESGVEVNGEISNITQDNGRILIVSFNNCTVTFGEKVLFQPEWGTFDMTCGAEIISVYGGPADFDKYQQFLPDDKPKNVKMESKLVLSDSDKQLNDLYAQIRNFRESNSINVDELDEVYDALVQKFPDDWLLLLELLELHPNASWSDKIIDKLNSLSQSESDLSKVIQRGLSLLN